MKKSYYISFFIFIFALMGVVSFAKEPPNLDLLKQKIIHYHDSLEYQKDINRVVNQALRYLCFRLEQPLDSKLKPAIILDIDETTLSNYHVVKSVDFGDIRKWAHEGFKLANDPVIEPTLKLYRYAKAHQVAVFFLSGRYDVDRQNTVRNLEKAGFKDWDGLILRSENQRNLSASRYKIAMRKQLTEQGYHIILNVGDQKSDLVGGYADKTFKLPNPFYYIP